MSEESPLKVAFIGNSHIAYWPLEVYFPKWECLNFGKPGEGIDYIESFCHDVSDCYAVIQFGSNDLYRLNHENLDAYADRYARVVRSVKAYRKFLFCIFPRNDYGGGSTAVNRFILKLNAEIRKRLSDADVCYMDVFHQLAEEGRLKEELTIDDLHLNGKGYQILADSLLAAMGQCE